MLKRVLYFLPVIVVFCLGYLVGSGRDRRGGIHEANAIEFNNAPQNIPCSSRDKISISCWREYGSKYYKVSWSYLPGFKYATHYNRGVLPYCGEK